MHKVLLCLIILCCSCAGLSYEKHPEYEFRGTWVATVMNIDWPKRADDGAEKQKKDFIKLLDFYENLNFNTLIVQVRTAGDAFYPSELAPWSRFITGEEGKSKDDFEDPLNWMIEQTHERGMQFHAWLNPYRATFDLDTTILAENHDFRKHPDWMVKYGKKYYYDPGNKEVQNHLTEIVSEVVENYNVDGIHFDDYFYPYKIKDEVFIDSISFQRNKLHNQGLEDWRRSNVDSLINKVHQVIKVKKPWVRFGVSPFGVWKNSTTDIKGSETKAGQTTYEDLYADPVLWMQKGWLDYIVPQAYWSMEYPAASHRIIMEWWAKEATNTNLYMGNGAYKIKNNADEAWNDKREIPKQLALARNTQAVRGNAFFSAKSLINMDAAIQKQLHKKFYHKKAINPPLINKPLRIIPVPILTSAERKEDNIELCISHFDSVPRYLSIYDLKKNLEIDKGKLLKKTYIPINESNTCSTISLGSKKHKKNFGILVEDAYGNRSEIVPIKRSKTKQ